MTRRLLTVPGLGPILAAVAAADDVDAGVDEAAALFGRRRRAFDRHRHAEVRDAAGCVDPALAPEPGIQGHRRAFHAGHVDRPARR